MRKDRLQELKGFRARFRPVARRYDAKGYRLPDVDDAWIITEVTQRHLMASNIRTQHFVRLSPDNIHHFEPDASRDDHAILELNAHVFLHGNNAYVERLVGPGRRPAHNPIQGPGREPMVIPIAGTANPTAEALWIGVVGFLLIGALGGFKS